MDENQSKEWNYHPNLPLADSSPFTHLTEPMFLLNWIYKNWLSLSERILMVELKDLAIKRNLLQVKINVDHV